MCCCGKPTINGEQGYRWNNPNGPAGVYPVNPPELENAGSLGYGDQLLLDLPGRCGGLDSHSYHYRLVKRVGLELLVRHGGGDERLRLSGPLEKILIELDETSAYWLLNAIYHAHSDGERKGREQTANTWRKAAASKRIRTRKQRGGDGVKVWIEHAK